MPYVRKTKRRKSVSRRLKRGGIILGAAGLTAITAVTVIATTNRTPPTPTPQAESYYAENAALKPIEATSAGIELPDAPAVFFSGDSLSDGWYATTEPQGFRPLVQQGIADLRPGATFEGTHRAGYTVQQVADGFTIPTGFDLAVVQLGTNDVTKATDPALFATQYADYVAAVVESSPDAGLICVGSFYHADAQSDAVDAVIEDVCTEHGGSYVNLTATYVTEGMRGPAGIPTWIGNSDMGHPNDAGHQRIADLVLAEIATS